MCVCARARARFQIITLIGVSPLIVRTIFQLILKIKKPIIKINDNDISHILDGWLLLFGIA